MTPGRSATKRCSVTSENSWRASSNSSKRTIRKRRSRASIGCISRMSENNPYDPLLLDHIKNARNYRELPAASHHAAGINPLCGDEMNVYAEVIDERIGDLGFQCSCCGISMASASIMTELMKSQPLSE